MARSPSNIHLSIFLQPWPFKHTNDCMILFRLPSWYFQPGVWFATTPHLQDRFFHRFCVLFGIDKFTGCLWRSFKKSIIFVYLHQQLPCPINSVAYHILISGCFSPKYAAFTKVGRQVLEVRSDSKLSISIANSEDSDKENTDFAISLTTGDYLDFQNFSL